jgi:tight adherence protein B
MRSAAAAAVGLAVAAGAVLPGDPAGLLGRVAADVPGPRPPRARGLASWLPVAVAPLMVAGATGSVSLAVAALLVTVAAARSLRARGRRRRSADRRTAALDLVGALVAELRAGAEPRAALATACGPGFGSVAAAARSPAGDPVTALVGLGGSPGSELLADLAVAWRVAASTGAGLAGPAVRLAESARAAEAVRRELDAQLAGPRATALLLSLLPAAGVLLGSGLGADPLGFLLGTAAGRGTLVAGAALVCAGVGWTEAIVRRATDP